MRRREFLRLATGAIAVPKVALGQQPRPTVKRVAFILTTQEPEPTNPSRLAAFREGIVKQGWVEGRNLLVQYGWGASTNAEAAPVARVLVDARPDVFLTGATPATVEVANLTRTIPIVFTAFGADPIQLGLSTSLARPSRNVTGFLSGTPAQAGKLVDLLLEMNPALQRVAFLYDPTISGAIDGTTAFLEAAAAHSVKTTLMGVRSLAEITPAIAEFATQPGGGVAIYRDAATTTEPYRKATLAALAAHRLPYVASHPFYEADGAVITYYVDSYGTIRDASEYVGLILNGTSLADLPIQVPGTFLLSVNLKTAKALGIAVPNGILLRADQVIE